MKKSSPTDGLPTDATNVGGSRRHFLKLASAASLASTWGLGTVAEATAGDAAGGAKMATTRPPRSSNVAPRGSVPGRNIAINGVNYHVGEQGAGDKVVVLLHGMPDTSSVWRFQIPALVNAGYRVIVPDLLGYGETDKPADVSRYQGEKLIVDALTMLDTLQLSKVDLVGHDWGGFLSWELALAVPDRVRRHVVISTGHPDGFSDWMASPNTVKENWYMYLNTQDKTAEMYAADDGAFLRNVLLPSHPEVDEVWSRMKEPAALTGMLNWDRANQVATLYLAEATRQGPPRMCHVPTLGLWSSHDTYMWEEQMTASANRMSAPWRYHRIENASHWAMLDQPERVTEHMLGWLGHA
jgi:pimeloyl-ACP methyl ester carboxylesterase